MRTLSIFTAVFLLCQAHATASDVHYAQDAALRAVQFVDGNEGWAVGDEGVIWHTIDGGKTWDRQATGLRASLRSVCFVNPFVGWVAGREELPGGGSVGVLLFTRDAGVKWQRILPNALPGLNVVKFTANPQVGFLLGDGSDPFPSGVFKTIDGGKSWEPLKGPRTAAWFAGDFQDANTGILAGGWGRLANFRQNTFNTAEIDREMDRRTVHGMQVLPDRILAVGQGGLILSSSSGGKNYRIDTKLPAEVRAHMDFHAIAAVQSKVWVAGRPGSVILCSEDQGASWKLNKTGQSMPLHGLCFLDQRGWAVGEAGTILHTRDGGQTWAIQKQGGQRAAVLFVHARPESLDVDTLARLGADEGYLTAALRCTVPAAGAGAWSQSTAAQRFAAGTRLAGGMTGETLWHFPLPQYLAQADRQKCLSYWNEVHGQADQHLLGQLVLALRMWRPSVVVGDSPAGQAPQPAPVDSLIQEALKEAVVQAADPKAFPEQIGQLGLQPWRVSRYYAAWDKKTTANIVFDNNKISPRLENSYRNFARPAASLLAQKPATLPLERCYRLLGSGADVKPAQNHFLDGLPQATGESRRESPTETISDEKLEKIRQENLRKVQKLSSFVLMTEKLKNENANQMLAQLGPMLDSVADEQGTLAEQGPAAALAVANNYARQGQWLLAREAFLLMVQKYPARPESAQAYQWLIRHGSSSEARRRHELGHFLLQTNTPFADPSRDRQGAVMEVRPVGASAENPNEARHWFRGSLEFGKRLSAFGALYASDPGMEFCLQSSRRQLGDMATAAKRFDKFVTYFPRGTWHDAAATELWLQGRAAAPAKPVAICRLTKQKPVLDGNFDEPCWQGMKPMVLQNAAGDTAEQCPTEACFAFDDQFLYLALRCRHPAEMHVPSVKNRPRDARLDDHDRVSIMLDLDRDYCTYFHLQIDQRGCVREDCWGDVNWNPKWFVAVKSTPQAWCIEAALPLSELTGEKIVPNAAAWACNVVRILPGRGVQAWSMPADVEPRPEGMGVLLFQAGK